MEVTAISYLIFGLCFFVIKAYADIKSGGLYPIIFSQLGHSHYKFSSYIIGFMAHVWLWPILLFFLLMEEARVKG